MKILLLWIFGAVFFLNFVTNTEFKIEYALFPFLFCYSFIILFRFFPYKNFKTFVAYLLFFSTSIFTLNNILLPLTGSINESGYIFLYGFPFYTATVAYLLICNKQVNLLSALKITNPLLLATGPIVLFFKNYSYRRLHLRINYYLPFFIVGLFLFQTVGAPLVPAFKLIEATDLVGSILFAVIFELFVYMNFCGLSLMLYGVFGIAGYKIPLNFKQPFSSKNIIEFWRGWHITLSAVLKILFYEPIRKHSTPGIALLVVFFASAMWHGVTLNFLIWGIFHASVFIITLFFLKRNINIIPTIILIIGVIFGRLIFADSNTDRLLDKLLFSYEGLGAFNTILSLPNITKVSLVIGFNLVAIEFFFRNTKILKKRNYKHLRTPLALAIMLIITIFLIDQGTINYAVYGQR